MNVTVALFAHAAEVVGARTVDLVVDEGARVSDVVDALVAAHPGLAPQRATWAYAVDDAWGRPDMVVTNGNVVVVIPPVSGG